jgi:hypothetical protein
VEIPLEQIGPSWLLDVEVPENWYTLRLRAMTADQMSAVVMTHDGPFEKECGARYDQRSDLDVWLFNALNSRDPISSVVVARHDIAEAICRCLTLADAKTGTEQPHRVEMILESLAPKVRLADIPRIEAKVLSCKPEIQEIAARAGIPTVLFESVRNDRSRGAIAPGQQEIFSRLCRPEMQSNDPGVESFCEAIETMKVPVTLAFIRLFRQTRTSLLNTSSEIEDALGSPAILQLTATVPDNSLEPWLGPLPASLPLFGRTVVTLWKLAYRVWLKHAQLPDYVVRPEAIIASRLLGNDLYHELLATAIAQVSDLALNPLSRR